MPARERLPENADVAVHGEGEDAWIIKALDHGGRLCAMASEEVPDIIPIPDGFRCGKYCLLFDPLDGSSNIDVNVPVGTIFSVIHKITRGARGDMEDMLQPGRRQVAAVPAAPNGTVTTTFPATTIRSGVRRSATPRR